MRIFDFDMTEARRTYAEQGWVHIAGGMDAEFLAHLRDFVATDMAARKLDRFAIRGKKEQALYSFPPQTNYPDELFDVVAQVCGLNRQTMTLSERHIQAYEDDADPEPQAHKDRYPSQVSVGFSVEIPEGSELVLYPYDHRTVNPFNAAAALIRSLQPHELPETVLPHARPVRIADRPGDVVMFPGSSTWHLRRNSANTVNLYVKLNDFDCDPLGEDPTTPLRREHTLAALEQIRAGGPDGQVVKLSRRFDFAERKLMRESWGEVLQAALYGEPPFGITEAGLAVLQEAGEPRPLPELIGHVAQMGHGNHEATRSALLLLERGALEVVN